MTAFDKERDKKDDAARPAPSRGGRGKRAPKDKDRPAGRRPSDEEGPAKARERISEDVNPIDTGERGPTGPAAI